MKLKNLTPNQEFLNSLGDKFSIFNAYVSKCADKSNSFIPHFARVLYQSYETWGKLSEKQVTIFFSIMSKYEDDQLRNESSWEYSSGDNVNTKAQMMNCYTNTYGSVVFMADNNETGHYYIWKLNPKLEKNKELLEIWESLVANKATVGIKGIVKSIKYQNNGYVELKSGCRQLSITKLKE